MSPTALFNAFVNFTGFILLTPTLSPNLTTHLIFSLFLPSDSSDILLFRFSPLLLFTSLHVSSGIIPSSPSLLASILSSLSLELQSFPDPLTRGTERRTKLWHITLHRKLKPEGAPNISIFPKNTRILF